jgi:hypothetical protein
LSERCVGEFDLVGVRVAHRRARVAQNRAGPHDRASAHDDRGAAMADGRGAFVVSEKKLFAFMRRAGDVRSSRGVFRAQRVELDRTRAAIGARHGTAYAISPLVRPPVGRCAGHNLTQRRAAPDLLPAERRERRMNRVVTRRLEAGVRVRDHSRANPSHDPNFTLVLGRLENGIERIIALGSRQVSGTLSRHASTVERRQVRRKLRTELLPHLVTVARDAAAEQPSLAGRLEIPGYNLSSARFHAAAKAMLDLGLAEKDLLLKHGLSDRLLPDLEAAVTQFAATITATNDSREAHINARAELERVSEEVMQLVEMLDGINRYRFRDDPHRMVAWEAAKHVVTGPIRSDGAAPPGGDQPSPPGPSGEVKPAA